MVRRGGTVDSSGKRRGPGTVEQVASESAVVDESGTVEQVEQVEPESAVVYGGGLAWQEFAGKVSQNKVGRWVL
jgi:hypothetical protein